MGRGKCSGMDRQFWSPDDINEYPCPKCSAVIEIWKDDVRVACPKCGALMVNPRIGNVCLAWCAQAADCLGNKDIDEWKKSHIRRTDSKK